MECNSDKVSDFGFCNAPNFLKVNTSLLHFGEEPALSGTQGSGTIFFSHCNMQCCYCQNYKISNLGAGGRITEDEFIRMALELQEKKANNINLVSPTPYTLILLPILEKLKKSGLNIPIIWNSNSYEKVETLKLLEGLIDIYLPDFRYWNDEVAFTYSKIKNYRFNAQEAIKEMIRQTGNLKTDEDEIAIFGTLIRLLILPTNKNEVDHIIRWLFETFGNKIYISLMSQYYPAHKAYLFKELKTGVSKAEYDSIVNDMLKLGFENGFIQEPATTPEWTPNFDV